MTYDECRQVVARGMATGECRWRILSRILDIAWGQNWKRDPQWRRIYTDAQYLLAHVAVSE